MTGRLVLLIASIGCVGACDGRHREAHARLDARDDARTTPVECRRASEVCSGLGADSATDRCTEMMGNLEADAANRTKLTTCLAAANNCYAFRDCIDKLWFDLD
jgi:hypothetical protein